MVSFDQSFNQGLAQSASRNQPMPIITGVARSGTTLLRMILDSHPNSASSHAWGFIPVAVNLTNPLSRVFYRRLSHVAKRGSWARSLREEFYRTVTGMNNWHDFHVPNESFSTL
jgi:hypothetical protein